MHLNHPIGSAAGCGCGCCTYHRREIHSAHFRTFPSWASRALCSARSTRSLAAASSAAFPAKHRQQQSCKPHAQLLSVAVPRRQTGQAEATHGFRPSPSRESSRALSVPHGDLSLSLPLSREGEREREGERGGGPPPTSSPCHPLATPDRPPRAGLQPSPAQQQGEKLSETGSAMTAQQQQLPQREINRGHALTHVHARARAHTHTHAHVHTHARTQAGAHTQLTN